MDHRGASGVGRVAPGCAALRLELRFPAIRRCPNDRNLFEILRYPFPELRAKQRSPTPIVAGISSAKGTRCGIRRKDGLGETELVFDLRKICDTRLRTPGVAAP